MTAESSRKALLAEFRTRLQEGQRLLREAYFADANAPAMLAGRCALIDGLLCDLWQSQAFPQDMALVAVGGYGRGELYPASDVDLLILLSAAPDEQLQAKLE
ncbi:MAG: [protein-PII] uridylyltransferase, partial [Pseudomonadota bacterium]|nr:[protein-PII] uridylyltransferase [Pseudomonadota bacterium]